MTAATPSTRLLHFIAGHTGPWIVERSICICGDPLPWTPRVAVVAEAVPGKVEAPAYQ